MQYEIAIARAYEINRHLPISAEHTRLWNALEDEIKAQHDEIVEELHLNALNETTRRYLEPAMILLSMIDA